MKLQDKFDYVVSELKEYLCVTQLIDDGGAPKIRVSAHVTGGRLHPRGEKIEYARDIKVLNGVSELSYENDTWCVRFSLGQTLSINEYQDINTAIEFIKKNVENYWKTKEERKV